MAGFPEYITLRSQTRLYWYGLKGHTETETPYAPRVKNCSCPLVKVNLGAWLRWSSLPLEEKDSLLQTGEHNQNCGAGGLQALCAGVFRCCRRDWCTSLNKWQHEERSCEAAPHHINQEVRTWVEMGLPKWKSVCDQFSLQSLLEHTSSLWMYIIVLKHITFTKEVKMLALCFSLARVK